VYRLLQQAGMSQREIARRTGQAQSEVSEIVQGRRVRDVEVLERIADGLGVPRVYLHLSGDAENAYPGGSVVTGSPEEVAEMYRRVLLANAGVALVGQRVDGLGELLTPPDPAPVPLPTRVEAIHVAQVRGMTRQLGRAGSDAYTDATVLSAAATRAEKLLRVSGSEAVKRALLVAVGELHLEAGWGGFRAWCCDLALHHVNRALELATQAGDAYLQAAAMNMAGVALREFGHPNTGLKVLQFGLAKAWQIPNDEEPRAVIVAEVGRVAREACVQADLASAYADLGDFHAAEREMAIGRGLWGATRADRFGDLDRPAAVLALQQGRLDTAEALAAASVRRWEGVSQVGHTTSGIVLATIHVHAGEPDGLPMAHGAITAVTKLSSVRAHGRLQPLATALAARPGRDAQDLAQLAHHTTATRA
jgi:transcriptional regulator with XRE-family HTH domain